MSITNAISCLKLATYLEVNHTTLKLVSVKRLPSDLSDSLSSSLSILYSLFLLTILPSSLLLSILFFYLYAHTLYLRCTPSHLVSPSCLLSLASSHLPFIFPSSSLFSFLSLFSYISLFSICCSLTFCVSLFLLPIPLFSYLLMLSPTHSNLISQLEPVPTLLCHLIHASRVCHCVSHV